MMYQEEPPTPPSPQLPAHPKNEIYLTEFVALWEVYVIWTLQIGEYLLKHESYFLRY